MKNTILVPDYFADFQCKCGSCRHPCCDGWGINVDENEYFSLIGLECSPRLRHRLDDAFVVLPDADEKSFASIHPNYLGQCPMLDTDGLCLLQKEQGEKRLPLICRVYPRALRKYGSHFELCTSASCEETVELLTRSRKPLTLCRIEAEPPFEGIGIYEEDPEKDALRYEVIALMGNTAFPIRERIRRIGCAVCGEVPDVRLPLAEALAPLTKLLERVLRVSPGLREYGTAALAFLNSETDTGTLAERFRSAEVRLGKRLPDPDLFAARLLANHLFYESFPYTPGTDSPDTAFAAFCTAAALMKVLCAAASAENDSREDLVDLIAFANRFFEHSDFYRICAHQDHPDGKKTFARFSAVLDPI